MSGSVPGRGLPNVWKQLSVLAAVLVAIVSMAIAGEALAGAADYQSQIMAGSGGQTSRTVKLGLNKSLIVELPRDARDVLVSNPAIADAVIRSSRRIYLTGVAVGETSIFVFDRDDQLIVNLGLEVERDISGLEGRLNSLIPGARISIDLFNDNIVLSGTVKNASDSRRAVDLASAFANGGRNSEAQQDRGNAGGGERNKRLRRNAKPAHQFRHQHAHDPRRGPGSPQGDGRRSQSERRQEARRRLGSSGCRRHSDRGAQQRLPGHRVSAAGTVTLSSGGVSGTLNLLEQEGLYRTLAEPTLTAISGESASFLAGGEFPVVTGVDNNGTPSITFKSFGVGLDFTPVVLSEGRISLRVRTEVSELSQDNAVTIGGEHPTTIPGLKVRRAETTLELPSGGSMIMGGLLQDNVRQAISGQPGLMKVPVLGTLFRSRDFQRSETELVIIVTPYLVSPTSVSALARPDDGFNPPSDAAGNFLGRLNRIYGNQGKPAPQGTYRGRYGFIYE